MRVIGEHAEFSFLHAADLHLGSPIAAARRAGHETELREATYAALDNVVRIAIEHDVDFVTVSGDLYDEADQANPEPQLRLRRALAELAPRPVFVIRGNHDHLGGRLTAIRLPENVHQFDATSIHADLGWVRVYGVSYPTRHVPNLLPRYPPGDPSKFNVGLFHGTVGDAGDHDEYSPCSLEDLRAKRYDVWALGHIHKRAVLSERPLIFYPGNIQGRNPRETGPKGITVVHVDKSGPTPAFHPTHGVLVETLAIDVSDCQDLQDVEIRVRTHVERVRTDPAASAGAVLRLSLVGQSEAHDEIAFGKNGVDPLAGLTDSLNAEFGKRRPFALVDRVIAATLPRIDIEKLVAEPNALGELVRVARRSDDKLRERLLATTLFRPEELSQASLRALLEQGAMAALPRLRGRRQ